MLDASFQGRAYPPSPVYEVGREKIAEFASAIGATPETDPAHFDAAAARGLGHPDVVAPPTYAVIIAQRAEAQYAADPASGIDFARVVHGEESFTHHRPIVAGDRLTATLHVDRVRVAGGHGMITTRVEIADDARAPVCTVTSMLVVRGEAGPA